MVTERKKAQIAAWDKKNMKTLSCRVTTAKAEEFQIACEILQTNKNQVFLKAIQAAIDQAKEKSSK